MAAEKKSPTKKKNEPKPTSTPRVQDLVDRLKDSGGKRTVIHFNADAVTALKKLIDNHYGKSQQEVVNKALIEVARKKF